MRRDLNPHAKGSCIWSNRVCQFHHSWLNHSIIFNEQPMLLDPRFLVSSWDDWHMQFDFIIKQVSSVLPSSEISRWVDSNHQPRNFKFPCSAVGIHRVKATSLSLSSWRDFLPTCTSSAKAWMHKPKTWKPTLTLFGVEPNLSTKYWCPTANTKGVVFKFEIGSDGGPRSHKVSR